MNDNCKKKKFGISNECKISIFLDVCHCLISKKKGFLLVRLSGRWKFHKRVIKMCEKVAKKTNILFKKLFSMS